MKTAFTLGALMLLLAAPAGAQEDLIERTLEHGGRRRSYLVHLPPLAKRKSPLPLVIVLHGGGGHAAKAARMAGMGALADKEGFALAFPNGTGRLRRRLLTWNSGTCCGYAMRNKVDDVGFISEMIDALAAESGIDRGRVYAAGFSNGGMMAHRLACELSPKIAAIGPVAGSLVLKPCRPQQPMPVMIFHGTADQHVPYAGGAGARSVVKRVDPPVSYARNFWVSVNGCRGKPKRSRKGSVVREVQSNCRGGSEVVLVTIVKGGHSWPGGKKGVRYGNIDPPTKEISASETLWRFFRRHHRRSPYAPGDYAFTLGVKGRARTYYVHLPPAYARGKPLPVVLNFHGGGGSPQGHRKLTRFDAKADRAGFIAVYPRGTRRDRDDRKRFGRFWNPGTGPSGPFYDADDPVARVDDVAFVKRLLDELQSRFRIDRRRIYAAGFSVGGMLANTLACRLPGRIAAAASIGGPLWLEESDCRGKRAVSNLLIHGTGDVCAPYQGGFSRCGFAKTDRIFRSAEDSAAAWRRVNACSKDGRISYRNGGAVCRLYACRGGSEVEFCRIRGAGHSWPGGLPYSIPGVEIGKLSYDMDANDAIWRFFRSKKLP